MGVNFPNDEIFLTTEEVLEYLQVNLRTVYRLIKAGKIPAVRVGRQWRFRKRDIDAWLDTQRPRGERAPSATVSDRPQARDGRSRVLVVDDESSIRELLQKTLALAEYDVDTAPDGRAALERLRLGNYDLLIADLKMPGMDGLTLDSRGEAIEGGPARDHHHRLLDRIERDRSGQSRRRRLPDQTVPRAPGAGGSGAGARRVGLEAWLGSRASWPQT